METLKLGFKAALFDQKSAIELSHKITKESLWAFKLSTTTFYLALFSGFRPAQLKSYQFLLENLHILPTTKEGWFHYHKQKNLVVLKEFIQKGTFNGLKYASVVALYAAGENLALNLRNRDDFMNSTLSSFAISVLWSTRVSSRQRALCIALGTSAGMAVGLLQDLYQHLYHKSIKEFYQITAD